jgi:hypothetical protein
LAAGTSFSAAFPSDAILVRPDGFIGFRAAPADEMTMGALDDHLTTYLVPFQK